MNSVMSVMGIEGDVKTIWNPSKPVEVEAAREQFDGLKKKGYLAYRVDVLGDKTGEVLRDFDSNAKALIMVPPMQGG
jgi:hypothetical protein